MGVYSKVHNFASSLLRESTSCIEENSVNYSLEKNLTSLVFVTFLIKSKIRIQIEQNAYSATWLKIKSRDLDFVKCL